MSDDITKIAAPALPVSAQSNPIFNILRLFFNRLVSAVNAIIDYFDRKADRENGFVDRSDSTISFVDGTRTFTITPVSGTFSYYHATIQYNVNSAKSVVISDTEGLHYIYFEGDILKSTTTFTPDIITVYAFVAVIYWDADNNKAIFFGEERHGNTMDSQTHSYNHQTFGARYQSGLALGNMVVDGNGSLATHARFSVSDGYIWDEDIQHAITDGDPQELSTVAEIPLYYRSGASGAWRKLDATTYPITTTGTGMAAWNEDTGATWQLTEATSGYYVLMHYYATNNINEPIIGIIGQAEYNNGPAAQVGAETEINNLAFGAGATLTPEFVAIATVIWQTRRTYSNDVQSRIVSTSDGADYIDWRKTKGGSGSSEGSGEYVPPNFRDESSTTYSMALTDANVVVRFTGASPAVTIPVQSTTDFSLGTELNIRQAGTGTLTLTTTSLTINGTVPSWAQHVEVKFRKVAADTWDVV